MDGTVPLKEAVDLVVDCVRGNPMASYQDVAAHHLVRKGGRRDGITSRLAHKLHHRHMFQDLAGGPRQRGCSFNFDAMIEIQLRVPWLKTLFPVQLTRS